MSGPPIQQYSAPPMEQEQLQQGMPAVPPSYADAMAAGPAPPSGWAAPPPPATGLYPPLEKGGVPPPGPPPVGQAGQPVQVVTQVQYVQGPTFGHRPVKMICPHCQADITTRTDSEPSALAWIICGVLCFVGCIPCCCIPFCVDSLNQVTHTCPSCKNTLGRYKGGL